MSVYFKVISVRAGSMKKRAILLVEAVIFLHQFDIAVSIQVLFSFTRSLFVNYCDFRVTAALFVNSRSPQRFLCDSI